jgi:hypothetical protein
MNITTIHLATCTSLLTGDEQTEYHNGPERCLECDAGFRAVRRNEDLAGA